MLAFNYLNKKVMWENNILTDNKMTEVELDYSPYFKCVVTHGYIQVLKTNSSAILSSAKISV